MRIAAGELAADGGTVVVDGGIALVHQHFLLVNELTIAENLALTATRFRYATRTKLGTEAAATIAATGIDLGNVSRRVEELSVGEKAKLELIKAIARNPATLILDEPTSVLTPTESEELFRVMRELAAKGTAVVFISHKLREVLAVADRIVVMRQGGLVAETLASETTAEELASIMVPAGMTDSRPAARDALPRAETPSFQFEDLAVHAGEIVAIVGVAGNGQTELAAALRAQMPDCGHIPEDRTRDGIIAEMTIAENLALKTKRWKRRDAMRHAEQMIALYSIRANGPRQRAGDLSGGNQQKVILARELAPHPRVIVAAEPTRGLDLEATRFVHTQLRNAAGAHAAIVLITSDLDEAFALADTMHVIYRGRLSERMSPQQASTRVANLMAGVA
jgi:simple sugar transport system ATP-binding protein